MGEVVINDDEMIGFIIRNVYESDGVWLSYGAVESTLDAQIKFYEAKGLIETADTAER